MIPHLWNLNEDPMLSGMITHFVPPGDSHVGRGQNCEIRIKGVAVQVIQLSEVATQTLKNLPYFSQETSFRFHRRKTQ